MTVYSENDTYEEPRRKCIKKIRRDDDNNNRHLPSHYHHYYYHSIYIVLKETAPCILSIMSNPRFEEAVEAMTKPENRFDVTIICTTDDHQADFWMSKLKGSSSTGKRKVDDADGKFPMVIAVSEDWTDPSGAGNGLGTLYAWQKAVKYAESQFQVDLNDLLAKNEISAALYHTAGKGTRLAPLPASENNNKPGVVRI